jgi:hypothetical protein
MPQRAVPAALVLGALLVAAGSTVAQDSRNPQRLLPQANICSTGWGWCPLPYGTIIPTEYPCACRDPRLGQPLPGVTRAFNYTAFPWPVSPYLNPHWVPP